MSFWVAEVWERYSLCCRVTVTRVVSDFKTCFWFLCNQKVVRSRTIFMKVDEKPCSVIGWPWQGQIFRISISDNIWCRDPLTCQWVLQATVSCFPSFGLPVTVSRVIYPWGGPACTLLRSVLQMLLTHPPALVKAFSFPCPWNGTSETEVFASTFSWATRRWLSGTGCRVLGYQMHVV